jgi:DNA helicase-2/ATP-dependent DNA helicase PcrA
MTSSFDAEYKRLNKEQKEAVNTIDGPVMVVAGPGTGKTQILALRIANILNKTDIKADGILCLTFTNSAVLAMKERLARYIGEASEKVNVFTFHSFGMKVVEEHFKVLGLRGAPTLLEDTDVTIFFDEIFNNNEWEYLRPRGDSTRYFSDLRSLISLLKRERITEENFAEAVEREISFLENDEGSISTRGESKGELKKDVLKQIEGLERSREIVKFIKLYEEAKKEKNVFDYDDILESLVKIVEKSENAVSGIRERYLYVLIDEHQDSSRVQNEFLEKVWSDVERPDVFVVGDDRQLIYGFSGASIDHFRGFNKTFKDAKLIPLLDNYRSTQVILDVSHALLQSVMSNQKLVSQSKEHHPIRLVEANTEADEIIAAGLDIKEKIKKGVNPNECAILVPKNKQVRNALEILHSLELPISSLEALNLFEQEEMNALLRVLKIIDNEDTPSFVLSFFDKFSGIKPLEAHQFFVLQNMREFSLQTLLDGHPSLFKTSNQEKWVEKLLNWKNYLKENRQNNDIQPLIEKICKEFFDSKDEKGELISGEDILNTVLSLLDKQKAKNPQITFSEFVLYLEKLKLYGENVPLVVSPKEGIKVLTMHSSKGLEFDYVWIAHMDERSLNSGKSMGFTLPEEIKERIEERDVDAFKRKLYVAITRAKRFCTLSYALESSRGSEQGLAKVIADLPPEILEKQKAKVVVQKESERPDLSELQKLVAQKYQDRYVSVSLLNNFFECPWKWYFRNLLQLPESKSASLEFGNAVHSVIDKILKMDHRPLVKELEDLSQDKEVMRVISKWAKERLPEISLKRENEQSVSVKDDRFPHLNLYGKIDLIERLDKDNIRVTDFKTGSVRKKSEIEKLDEEGRMSTYLRQLVMYAYLIKQNPKWKVDVRESRLEFLEAKNKKEALYDHVISGDEVNLLIKDISDYDKFIKNGEWLNRPCDYNSYGKNTTCEYCKMSEVYR